MKKISSKELAIRIAKLAEDKKGEDIVILDLRKISFFTDYFVIITGNSAPHVKAIKEAICEKYKNCREEVDLEMNWVLLDFIDVVVHIFTSPTRSYYNLERIWGDAKRVRYKNKYGKRVD
jgi:ribosome-associated protein